VYLVTYLHVQDGPKK